MNPMAEQVGPEFYDETALGEALAAGDADAVDAARLAQMRESRQILALHTADGQFVYPTWQVSAGAVLAGLPEVLAAFAGQPVWSIGLWLRTPHDELADRTPADELEAGGDVVTVVRLARETAERWA